MKRKYQREKLGNVYAIALPDGKFGFGRLFKDGAIAIYRHLGQSIEDTPQTEEYKFTVGVYKDVLTCGDWPVIENRPFENEEEGWPPPKYIWDVITGTYDLYYKGQITSSTKSACTGLEAASVWDAHHIIERIMGDDHWQKTTPEYNYIQRNGQAAFDELTKDS